MGLIIPGAGAERPTYGEETGCGGIIGRKWEEGGGR